ncbi:hypothetical protein [Streptomyces sp. NPDC087300]
MAASVTVALIAHEHADSEYRDVAALSGAIVEAQTAKLPTA